MVRLIALIILIVALSEPIVSIKKPSNQLSILFDTSYSIPLNGQAELLSTLSDFIKRSPNSDLKLNFIPFAKHPIYSTVEIEGGKNLQSAFNSASKDFNKLDSSATDIETALRKASSYTSPILLVSDGFETQNNAISFAKNLATQNISVFPLIPINDSAFNAQEVSISSIELPLVAGSGDKPTLRTTIKNSLPDGSNGTLEVFLDAEKISSQQIALPANQEKLFTAELPELKDGMHKVTAKLVAGKFSDEAHKWITAKEKEKILLLSENAGEHKIFEKFLRFGVCRVAFVPDAVDSHAWVVPRRANHFGGHLLCEGFPFDIGKFCAGGAVFGMVAVHRGLNPYQHP